MRVEAGRPECKKGGASECVCVCTCMGVCVHAYTHVCARRPRLVFLIDLARDLSDLQDNSKFNRCWWRWRDGKQDVQEEKKGRILKIDSRESGAGNSAVRAAEIVKLY